MIWQNTITEHLRIINCCSKYMVYSRSLRDTNKLCLYIILTQEKLKLWKKKLGYVAYTYTSLFFYIYVCSHQVTPLPYKPSTMLHPLPFLLHLYTHYISPYWEKKCTIQTTRLSIYAAAIKSFIIASPDLDVWTVHQEAAGCCCKVGLCVRPLVTKPHTHTPIRVLRSLYSLIYIPYS